MNILLADIETDGLLDDMSRLWCIQLGDPDGTDSVVYSDHALPDGTTFPPISEAVARMAAADRVVFHNGIGFDYPALYRLLPGALPWEKLIDSLVVARLVEPEVKDHTLKAWGKRTGTHKGDYAGDFQTFDADLVTYATQDIPTLRALWRDVWPRLMSWGDSAWNVLALEQEVHRIIWQQERNGFLLDIPAAERLAAELQREVHDCETQLRQVFKPRWVKAEPDVTTPKTSSKKFGFQKDVPYQKMVFEEYNPSSRQQTADRLMAMGWKPKKMTPSGAPVVDEETLAGLHYPEAKLLVRYFRAQKLLGQVSDGNSGWLKLVGKDGRVRGRVNPIGANTHRMSHYKPNMAQVSKDHRARGVWIPRNGWRLVGSDAEGLEARMLAHYLFKWDNGAFSEMVVSGVKGVSDVHTANLKAIAKAGIWPQQALDKSAPSTVPEFKSCFDAGRDTVKRILYALMYGAGDPKLGSIAVELFPLVGLKKPKGNVAGIGQKVRAALGTSMVGINDLTEACKKRTKSRGYLLGIDGRRLPIRSEHSALNSLLQGGGAIVMKKALVLFDQAARERGWKAAGAVDTPPGEEDFGYCANVHDEVQIEARPEIAEEVGQLFASCIVRAGQLLGVKCPLAGSSDVGDSWAATH